MALTFDQLSATTYKNHKKTMVDNITKKTVLLRELSKAGRVERTGGGLTYVEPLMYGENTTAKSYSGRDILDTSPQDGMTAAEYTPKNAAVTIEITKEQEDQNKGVPKMVDLLKSKFDQAEKSIRLMMGRQLASDGTGNGSKDFNGLKAFIKYNVTASVSVGGINQATYDWWRNQIGITTVFATDGVSNMRHVFNLATRDGDMPNFIVSDQTSHEAYEDTLFNIERIPFSKDLTGDAGFTRQSFKGVPFEWDYYVALDTTDSTGELGRVYFLNLDFLKLKIDPDVDFALGPWKTPYSQALKGSQIFIRGELTCSNRQQHGIMTVTGW